MMKHKSFVVFILTHGRASNVKTLKTLKKAGYTGKVVLVIDDEDEMEEDYKRIYGKNNVYIFNKAEAMKQCDTIDNFEKHNIVLYARNKCWDIAKELDYDYFLVLDDDYTQLAFKVVSEDKFKNVKVENADALFDIMVDYMDVTGAYTVAFAQGGDFIGGKDNKRYYEKILRKAMNSFFCKTNRPFKFLGTINEDTNAYCLYGTQGKLFLTYTDVVIEQMQTQKNKKGLTDIYLDLGTYVKSFYSVICCPSCVTVSMMGGTKKTMRLHHNVSWNNCTPKIISDKYKKI